MDLWNRYQEKYEYAAGIDWPCVVASVKSAFEEASIV
jgi:hypothetical protein